MCCDRILKNNKNEKTFSRRPIVGEEINCIFSLI